MTTSHTPEDRSVNSSLLKAHTPGRLEVAPCGDDDYAASIQQIDGDPYPFVVADAFTREDARRMVAAWNACDGIGTLMLEKAEKMLTFNVRELMAQRDELLSLLSEVSKNFTREDDLPKGLLSRIDAAIAKAEGKA